MRKISFPLNPCSVGQDQFQYYSKRENMFQCVSSFHSKNKLSFRPYSSKLELLRRELNLASHYRANRDTLGILFCCRTDECGELIQTYLVRSLGIESIFIHGNADKSTKIRYVHDYNFTRGVKALILNTQAGNLPLSPQFVEKVIIYEDELVPEVDEIFQSLTLARVNPKRVTRLLCENTIEEKIKDFQPKIVDQKIHGVHSLLIDIEYNPRPIQNESSTEWQRLLFQSREIDGEDPKHTNEIHNKNSKLSDEIDDRIDENNDFDENNYASDYETDLEDELTAIEKYALDSIRYEQHFEEQKQSKMATSFFKKTKNVIFPVEDLFISATAAEEVCVDQKGEAMPIWTPPTPPHVEEYRQEIWSNGYETTAMNITSAAMKQFKRENIIHQKSDHDLPLSFFNRSSKLIPQSRLAKEWIIT